MTTPDAPLPSVIAAVCLGAIRDFPAATSEGSPAWRSAIQKTPTDAVALVRKGGIEGDEQADRRHHGGPDQALLAYSAEHYAGWRNEFQLEDFPFGAFGENLTITGMTEHEACIGDIVRVGTATLQVTMPRFPCWKLARRWGLATLTDRTRETGRVGWYLRVLDEGSVQRGGELTLVERPRAEWSVARVHEVMHDTTEEFESARQLSELAELSKSWRSIFAERINS